MNYYKDIHLDVDILFVNKIQIFLMIYWNVRFMYFKTFLPKHNTYIQDKLQPIIQLRRLKNVFTVMEGDFKNIVDWIHNNLHIYVTTYMADSQMPITDNIIQVMNDLVKQEVTPDRIKFYNIHYESIILDLFTNGDLYDNASYTD